eukprot:3971626-Prymnesium_polylepis.3
MEILSFIAHGYPGPHKLSSPPASSLSRSWCRARAGGTRRPTARCSSTTTRGSGHSSLSTTSSRPSRSLRCSKGSRVSPRTRCGAQPPSRPCVYLPVLDRPALTTLCWTAHDHRTVDRPFAGPPYDHRAVDRPTLARLPTTTTKHARLALTHADPRQPARDRDWL